MKKIIFLSAIVSIALISNINANRIQDAVQQLRDEIIPIHTPVFAEADALIEKLTPHRGLLWIYTDTQQDIIRRDPQTLKLLCSFYSLNAQALGISYCHKCINKVQNPTANTLKDCHEQWLKSDKNKSVLDHIGALETYLSDSDSSWFLSYYPNPDGDHRELKKAFHEGNHELEKSIRKIIEEQSQQE